MAEVIIKIQSVDAKDLFRQSLIQHKEYLAELNKKRLKEKGMRSDGQKLPGYSNPYKKTRAKSGKQTAYKDLSFSNDFNRGIKALPFAEYIEFNSIDWKADILDSNWGSEIYGLTDAEWRIALNDRIIPTFNELLLNALFQS